MGLVVRADTIVAHTYKRKHPLANAHKHNYMHTSLKCLPVHTDNSQITDKQKKTHAQTVK